MHWYMKKWSTRQKSQQESGGAAVGGAGSGAEADVGVEVGSAVQIAGLQKGAQYNGMVGLVEAYEPADGEAADQQQGNSSEKKGRWVVRLVGVENKKLKIKSANLHVMTPPGAGGAGGGAGAGGGRRKKGAREQMEAAFLGMAQKKNEMGS